MTVNIWKPSDNTDNGEKIIIRKKLLEQLQNPSVLECFAGHGHIWRECYTGLPYLGLDLKPIKDQRNILQIDNRKFLRSADLSPFNLFDIDAYGSPWHQFLIIMNRRKIIPGEKIAIAITDGLTFKMSMSDCPIGLKKYIGIPPAMKIPCLSKHQEFINRLLVQNACKEKNLQIQTALIATNKRKNMKYIGLLLQG